MVFLTLLVFSRDNRYLFDHLTRKEGLANSSVSSIVQDKNGFLWFGTQGGLNRYDGKNFVHYGHDPYEPNSIPHNLIQTMYLDYESNILWLGTYNGLTRFDINTETFTSFKHDPHDKTTLSDPVVTAITKGAGGDIWVGTLNGLNRLDTGTGEFRQYYAEKANTHSISDNTIRSLLCDSKGRLWIGSYGGLDSYNPEKNHFEHHLTKNPDDQDTEETGTQGLESPFVMAIKEDDNGILWIGNWGAGLVRFDPESGAMKTLKTPDDKIYTVNAQDPEHIWLGSWGGGLFEYIPETNELNTYRYDKNKAKTLSHDIVYSIFEDNSGIIWIGTNGNGINKLNRNKKDYRVFSSDAKDDHEVSRGKIYAILEDHKGDLWIGAYGTGLNRYIKEENKMVHYQHDPEDPDSLSNDIVTFLYEDSKQNIWIGTNDGLNRFRRETDDFEVYGSDDTVNTPSGNIPFAMEEDAEGRLWIGYYENGMDIWNREENTFTNYRHDPDNPDSLSNNLVYNITMDPDEVMWIGTNEGLNRYDEQSDGFVKYLNNPDDKNSLSNNTVRSVFADDKDQLWIGTTSGGLNLFKKKDESFTHYTEKDGLSDNIILAILEDKTGKLWLSTTYGISVFNPETEVFTTLSEDDGLWGMDFTPGHEKTADGTMYFGSMHGVYAFKSSPESSNQHKPEVQVIDVKVMNETYESDKPHFLLEEITLPHDKNFISFEFVGIDYHSPEKNQYAYKLEGLNEDWIYSGNRNFVSYSSLPPGNYRFKVKASNNNGVWSDEKNVIELSISNPPYRTWWAYLIYILIVLFVLFLIKKAIDLKLKKEKAEAANTAKSSFLANMSHEIRTPLNTVIGFSDLLVETPLNKTQKAYTQSINNSAHSLLGIINDILDFSKIEAGKMDLESVHTDMEELIEETLDIVKYTAEEKGIELRHTVAPELPVYALVDPLRLKQILINLLSNAIKFTDKGFVELRVDYEKIDEKNGRFFFSVKDTGIGISEAQKKSLFKAFTQADISTSRQYGGTGLGLTISNLIAEKMGTGIRLESREGVGSTFSFEFSTEYFMERTSEKATQTDQQTSSKEITVESNKQPQALSDETPRIMIAEDVAMNLLLIKTLITKALPDSTIIEAKNGKEAYQNAVEQPIDLIFMDIQMPEMDGIEATRKIRQESNSSNRDTPIIALTAEAIKGKKEDCLKAGMDEFLTKPVDREQLNQYLDKYFDGRKSAVDERIKQAKEEQERKHHFNEEKILEKIDGDEETYQILINTAIKDINMNITDLRNAVENNDEDTLEKKAHAIKGTSREICFERMADISREIEKTIQEGERENISTKFNELEKEWENVQAIINTDNN